MIKIRWERDQVEKRKSERGPMRALWIASRFSNYGGLSSTRTEGGHLARGACHPTGEFTSGGTYPKESRRCTLHLHILHAPSRAASLRTGKESRQRFSTELYIFSIRKKNEKKETSELSKFSIIEFTSVPTKRYFNRWKIVIRARYIVKRTYCTLPIRGELSSQMLPRSPLSRLQQRFHN